MKAPEKAGFLFRHWHNIFAFFRNSCMNTKDPNRNTPTEKGRNNDPNLRDESAAQPGISTVSNSDYDEANEDLTKTAADDFREKNDFDPNADRSFDETGKE
jgi:pyocin large subunit-like protein